MTWKNLSFLLRGKTKPTKNSRRVKNSRAKYSMPGEENLEVVQATGTTRKTSKSDDPLSPDYVLSQFQYVSSPQKKKSKVTLETFNRRCVVSQSETYQSLMSMSASAHAEYCVEVADEQEDGPQIPDTAREMSIQTDLSMTVIEALQKSFSN
ncbi:uncharacterized protein LOC143249441 isoform X2 [Tachypleus tridentatus]|uniref:uncharacterized protein LOC143249441 isoform X2 n=1 Tax=Tachypleus tridentatus TaxID=6853 RepID=UPI003FD5A1E2